MSEKKHLRVLAELSSHPINHNIEWAELMPALESIGLMHSESNGKHDFSRNGHTLVLEQHHDKPLNVDEVMHIRRFLKSSAVPETEVPEKVATGILIAIDYHHAIIWYSPGTPEETVSHMHADLSDGKTLHFHSTSPPFNDSNPKVDDTFFEMVVEGIKNGKHIVILSHGTGSSKASEHLLDVIHKKRPELAHHIIGVTNCDMEAMTEPELAKLGVDVLSNS